MFAALADPLTDAQLATVATTLVANHGAERTAIALYAALVRYSRLEREHAANADDPTATRLAANRHAHLSHLIGEAVRRTA